MINCADVPDVASAGFQHRHSSYLFFMRERHSFAIKRETGVQLVELSLDAAPTSALAQAYKRSISRISLNSESCKATLESKNEKNMQLEMS